MGQESLRTSSNHRFGSTCYPKRCDQNEHRFEPLRSRYIKLIIRSSSERLQHRPDLLDASITNLPISIDSAAPATQNGVTKMSTVLYHSDLDTSNRLFGVHQNACNIARIIATRSIATCGSMLPRRCHCGRPYMHLAGLQC